MQDTTYTKMSHANGLTYFTFAVRYEYLFKYFKQVRVQPSTSYFHFCLLVKISGCLLLLGVDWGSKLPHHLA
jgi:hypothetical protein